jgi:hypothetical protein
MRTMNDPTEKSFLGVRGEIGMNKSSCNPAEKAGSFCLWTSIWQFSLLSINSSEKYKR